eukprot:scaffold83212_cov59-Attheya_sp.AAC.3
MDVQQGYLRHNISDHPSISSKYIKFLATNSGLQKKVKFWMWPDDFIREARDGTSIFMWDKLTKKVREQGYIKPGLVSSLTNSFGVPKVIDKELGEVTDIRMVYDTTQSSLNEALWALNFPMPMLSSVMRMVSYETYMMDQDLGEMFLNFMLDPKSQPYAGVDLTHVAEAMGESLPKGKRLLE